MKQNIEYITKLLPVGYFFLIFCSSIKLVTYYAFFGINITDFISIAEYATLFVDDILVYLAMFGFGLLLNISTKNNNKTSEATKLGSFGKVMIGLIILTVIAISILAYNENLMHEKLSIIKVGTYISLIWYYLMQQSRNSGFSFLILTLIAVVIYTLFDGFIDANKILEKESKFDYVLLFENKQINTAETLFYLGKSSDFIYLYDKVNKKAKIISTDKLMEIEIVEKTTGNNV